MPLTRIDDGDDAARPIMPRDRAVEESVAAIGPGSATPVVSTTTRANGGSSLALAPEVQALERLLQRIAERAAQAAGIEEHDVVLAAAVDEHVIEADLAQLVDDDCGVGERGLAQQPRQQRRLAAAQEAGEHVDGSRQCHPACCVLAGC